MSLDNLDVAIRDNGWRYFGTRSLVEEVMEHVM